MKRDKYNEIDINLKDGLVHVEDDVSWTEYYISDELMQQIADLIDLEKAKYRKSDMLTRHGNCSKCNKNTILINNNGQLVCLGCYEMMI